MVSSADPSRIYAMLRLNLSSLLLPAPCRHSLRDAKSERRLANAALSCLLQADLLISAMNSSHLVRNQGNR